MAHDVRPTWWTQEHESGWDRVKAALRRDWEQTKHDFTRRGPDLNQDVDDTVKQAAGNEPIPPAREPAFEDYEPAYRFGYGARRQYGPPTPEWDENIEQRLRSEWGTLYPSGMGWDYYRLAIRRGWEYEPQEHQHRRAA